mmetsp:Transcript_89738/g.179263  ORF Transcript_89738/g.179263 Transcript_89738/m.179263 type:complete len:481 (+) Transcript_89738:114-1556(+)
MSKRRACVALILAFSHFRCCEPFAPRLQLFQRVATLPTFRAAERPLTELNIKSLVNGQDIYSLVDDEEKRRRDAAVEGEDQQPQSTVSLPKASAGLVERWEELGGNFLLRPPAGVPARAVLHYLGGAFVGAAPHVTYRYLLQGFADAGYVVVATPYSLGFDYLEVCDSILDRFEACAPTLAREYGFLPVVGMGHSCGALLQVLITCLFPGTPRAANALISFNNKQVSAAIPAFEEFFQPVAQQAMSDSPEAVAARESLGLVRQSLEDVLTELIHATDPTLKTDDPAATGESQSSTRDAAVQALGSLLASVGEALVQPPQHGASSSVDRPDVVGRRLVDARETLRLADQIPPLFQAIAEGTVEFTPTPDDTKAACRSMYRARRTLLVKFENDAIDESEELMGVISEAKEIMRLKRPMVNFDIRLETISGDHVTPLTQDVFLDTEPLKRLPQGAEVQSAARERFLKTVDGTQKVLLDWLAEV